MGWHGVLEQLYPGADGLPSAPVASEPFAVGNFQRYGITAAFSDGLICSVPEIIPERAFTLEVGCRVASDRFQQLSLIYDDEHRLHHWERRTYRR